jgi:hypothetical protein
MSIIRVHHTRDYSVIRNAPMRDRRLSFEARGVWGYLMTKPDDWEVNTEHLLTESEDNPELKVKAPGRDKILRMLRELEFYGYLFRRREHNPQTGEWEFVTHVYENPADNPDFTGELPAPSRGYVFLVQVGAAHKIGKSGNVATHMRYLRGKAKKPVELLVVTPVDDMDASEEFLHARFADKRIEGRSSWYVLDAADIEVIARFEGIMTGRKQATPPRTAEASEGSFPQEPRTAEPEQGEPEQGEPTPAKASVLRSNDLEEVSSLEEVSNDQPPDGGDTAPEKPEDPDAKLRGIAETFARLLKTYPPAHVQKTFGGAVEPGEWPRINELVAEIQEAEAAGEADGKGQTNVVRIGEQ